jgi:hypothetical protein
MTSGQTSVPTTKPAAPVGKVKLSRKRGALVWTLLVLASLITLVSILTTWVNRQMLDTSSWQSATTQVVQDDEVRAALATRLVNQYYENNDVAASLEQRLPKDLKGLAAPLAGALREPSVKAVDTLLSRPRFQKLVINASTVMHEKLINVLENKTGHGISTGNGEVTIDLTVLLRQVASQLGLPVPANKKLPPDAGVVTVMSSDQLSAAQDGFRVLKALSAWLLVLVVVLYGLAIYLAHGARRVALARVGWSLIFVGVLLLVIRRLLGNYVVDTIASGQARTPVHHIWLIGTSILGDIGWATVLYGSIATLGAMLAGPSSLAVGIRRRIAPVLNERPGITWGGFAGVYLLLILWGGTHALRTWWGVLLLGGLLAFGLEALHRQTRIEFAPAAKTPSAPPPSGAER